MVAEIADPGINWMEPRDLEVGAMSMVINDRSRRPGISSYDPGGPHAVCVDGSRRVLNAALPPRDLEALMTISGGDAVDFGTARSP